MTGLTGPDNVFSLAVFPQPPTLLFNISVTLQLESQHDDIFSGDQDRCRCRCWTCGNRWCLERSGLFFSRARSRYAVNLIHYNAIQCLLSAILLGLVAAEVQSTVYADAVASGSLFSVVQGAAMGGVPVASAGAVAAGTAAICAGAWAFNKARRGWPTKKW